MEHLYYTDNNQRLINQTNYKVLEAFQTNFSYFFPRRFAKYSQNFLGTISSPKHYVPSRFVNVFL